MKTSATLKKLENYYIEQIRPLQSELKTLPMGSPEFAQVQQQLRAHSAELHEVRKVLFDLANDPRLRSL
ncbi:hypothetical protein [Hymenobacter baengnokdamensis]|uniref:hypothetical protein n=1 Tax=Hymenobacter baengnokdamensis TaxID=2615203 RepID=UPI0012459D67|nr:hypothetical protein [Hymenobacter baengnokdamensis]